MGEENKYALFKRTKGTQRLTVAGCRANLENMLSFQSTAIFNQRLLEHSTLGSQSFSSLSCKFICGFVWTKIQASGSVSAFLFPLISLALIGILCVHIILFEPNYYLQRCSTAVFSVAVTGEPAYHSQTSHCQSQSRWILFIKVMSSEYS